MPDTLLNSDLYEGWRKFEISNNECMHLIKVTDWSKADHPFKPVTDKFLTYFISKGNFKQEPTLIGYRKKFPKRVKISDVNGYKNWNEVEKFFTSKNGKLIQLSSKSNRYSKIYGITTEEEEKFKILYGKNDYKARQGVELTPR